MKEDLFANRSKSWDSKSLRVQNAKAIANKIIENINLNKNMHLLDLGAGTGLLSFFLSDHIRKITALDNSASMLEVFKSKQDRFNCQTDIIYADITKERIDEKFDGIISSMTIHHIKDIKKLFETLRVLLNPGGFIALADLVSEDGSFHDNNTGVYHKGFDIKELTLQAKQSGFKEIKITHAGTIKKPHNSFDVFLLTAFV